TEVLLYDGKVRLRFIDCGADFADTECLVGGTLSYHKGVNVPGAVLPISAMTEKDRADLSFALGQGADWVALSFVQRPEDVAEGRKLIGNAAGLMVKLEKPAAIRRLDEIIDLADALMVARGDLGVEMPPEDVPRVQQQIIHACRLAGKPVIVATQMLESMITAPTLRALPRWCRKRCARRSARRSPGPGSASSSPPACRSGPRARPTSCASPGSSDKGRHRRPALCIRIPVTPALSPQPGRGRAALPPPDSATSQPGERFILFIRPFRCVPSPRLRRLRGEGQGEGRSQARIRASATRRRDCRAPRCSRRG